jgi:hypothetical protein
VLKQTLVNALIITLCWVPCNQGYAYDDQFGPYEDTFLPDSYADSVFWKPFGSFFLPGLGQYMDGHIGYGLLYSGVGLAGMAYASNVASNNGLTEEANEELTDEEKEAKEKDEELGVDTKDINLRKIMWGQQVYQTAGGFSAYHSFRSTVRSKQRRGEYQFLTQEESPGDLMLAPLRMDFLARKTTWIPLLVGASIAGLVLTSDPGDDLEKTSFTQADAFFTTALSFNAGTHEEAMFRGWLQPWFYESWGSEFWANGVQSVIFAAAHLPSNPTPLPQLILGYHLGYVTNSNNWTLSESVFIHTWWDILAFGTLFHYKRKLEEDGEEEAAARIKPILRLPPLTFTF